MKISFAPSSTVQCYVCFANNWISIGSFESKKPSVLTCLRASFTSFCTSFAMFIIVLSAFFRTHRTHCRDEFHIVFFDFTLSLNQSRSEHADVSAVASQFNASRKKRNIIFVQTCRLAALADNSAINKLLLKWVGGCK